MKNTIAILTLINSVLSGKVIAQRIAVPVLNEINKIPEDGTLNFTELSVKYNHRAEEHFVLTQDGYILTVFRISGKGTPVLLLHGIVDSATTFILRGHNSLAVVLAEAGYDVWLGNMRGSKYSRKHITLNPDTDRRFWNFSMHEIAIYDLPAMIDHILNKTNSKQIAAIGHSEGNTVFFALGASKPEYNDKVSVLIALAPICFLHHIKPPINAALMFSDILNEHLIAAGQEEILGDNSTIRTLITQLCSTLPFSYEICGEAGFLFLAGYDPSELDEDFLKVVIWHYPVSTSRKNAFHLAQIGKSKRFQQFDYGYVRNIEMYGSEKSPEYNLTRVTMRVELFMGRNDKLSTIKDVNILKKKLPNVNYRLLKNPNMNHLDFVWGLHMHKYLYPPLLEVLKTDTIKLIKS